MDSASIAGWAMWGVFLLATVIYWLEIGFDILSEVTIFLSDALRALACTLVTSWFLLIPEWSKLHLFWLALLDPDGRRLRRISPHSGAHPGDARLRRPAADQAQPVADDRMVIRPAQQSGKSHAEPKRAAQPGLSNSRVVRLERGEKKPGFPSACRQSRMSLLSHPGYARNGPRARRVAKRGRTRGLEDSTGGDSLAGARMGRGWCFAS